MFKKLSALTLAILLIWVATLVMNYFFHYFRARAVAATRNPEATTDWPDPSYFYTFSVLAISLVSFMSFLYFSREVRGRRGAFEDGDVRFAITCTFVTVFLTLLSFYSFASVAQPTEIGKQFFNSFLSLTAIIVGFYFATTGALEFAKMREVGNEESQGKAASPPTQRHNAQE